MIVCNRSKVYGSRLTHTHTHRNAHQQKHTKKIEEQVRKKGKVNSGLEYFRSHAFIFTNTHVHVHRGTHKTYKRLLRWSSIPGSVSVRKGGNVNERFQ